LACQLLQPLVLELVCRLLQPLVPELVCRLLQPLVPELVCQLLQPFVEQAEQLAAQIPRYRYHRCGVQGYTRPRQ